jgi:hypothetical protein
VGAGNLIRLLASREVGIRGAEASAGRGRRRGQTTIASVAPTVPRILRTDLLPTGFGIWRGIFVILLRSGAHARSYEGATVMVLARR